MRTLRLAVALTRHDTRIRRSRARALCWALVAGVVLAGGRAPALGAQQAATPPAFSPAWRELAAHFHQRVEDEGVVGGSLWFVHDGTTVARELHGFADLATQRRVDERTIYHWASNTKTLTGIAIAGDSAVADLVLPPASLDEMWQAVVPMRGANAGDNAVSDEWTASMGLTFFVYERGSTTVIGHTGSQKSFFTFFYVDPLSRSAAIAAFNTAGRPKPEMRTVLEELRARLFATIFPVLRP